MPVLESLFAAGHPLRVLIVDRDPDTRGMYAEYLQLAGCDLTEASDGPEALAKAIAHPPDVVVTETRLSGFTGYELCVLLRRDVATRSAAIVVVTGDGFAGDIERALGAGADAVLVKPCLPDQLVAEVRRLLKRVPLHQSATPGATAVEQRAAAAGARRAAGPSKRMARLTATHQAHETTQPPLAPPALACPACGVALVYRRSQIGGVSARHSEQWDYFECARGCGTYQYRQRTRKLRRVS